VNNYYYEDQEDHESGGDEENFDLTADHDLTCLPKTKGCIFPSPQTLDNFNSPGYCTQTSILQNPFTFCDPVNAVPCFESEEELAACVYSSSCSCPPPCHNCYKDVSPFFEQFGSTNEEGEDTFPYEFEAIHVPTIITDSSSNDVIVEELLTPK
jgi:hypothetical protein